jgi:ABC-2 type transport system permease protein
MSSGTRFFPGGLRAYVAELWFECLRVLRQPAMFVPLIVMPLAFYLLLGVAMAPLRRGAVGPHDVSVFVSFLIYGVTAPGLCGIGVTLALERSRGLIRLKRALPSPPAAYILAKLGTSLLIGAAVAALLTAMALTVGGVRLDEHRILALLLVMTSGILPACAMGLFVATWFPPSGAAAVANTLFLALMMLGGLFYPLPASLDAMKPVWPTFHLQQLGLAAAGAPSHGDLATHFLALLGATVLFSAMALVRMSRMDQR